MLQVRTAFSSPAPRRRCSSWRCRCSPAASLALALALRLGLAQDKTRTGTYKQAIMAHADECFKDKVVLDVGCGTGILSFFAAQAGAKRVYAVDASDIVSTAASVVESNGMADVIKVVKGTVEDVELPGTLPPSSCALLLLALRPPWLLAQHVS